ncbi:MAG: AAA family ATPase [Treponema sp.]|nr:AAA family ATPase [Treponema sp.]
MNKVYLKSVDIVGFKSVALPVHIDFFGNLNAILGLKDTGKSNILEAVGWCLSDEITSYRDIFSGNDKLKEAKSAEATLTFSDSEGKDLNISRKIQPQDNKKLEDLRFINGQLVSINRFKAFLSSYGLSIPLFWNIAFITLSDLLLDFFTATGVTTYFEFFMSRIAVSKPISFSFITLQKEFQNVFPKIIKGGKAILDSIKTEDNYPKSFKLSVQFPGKPMLDCSDLSHKEKILTSYILLLAVYKTSPKPLCLLDDVDNDYYVELNKIIESLSEETQCIVVTNTKETLVLSTSMIGVSRDDYDSSKVMTLKKAD